MTQHTGFEVKAASALFGLFLIFLAAVVGLEHSRDPLHFVLASRGRDNDWALMLSMVGAMVFYGSVRPKRKCRQIGLALSMFLLASMFGMVLEARWLTVSTVMVFFLVVSAAVLLLADVVIGSRERERRNAQGS